ncbi:Uncharacterized protein TPAR_01468 [Tolypocladium paradoxum]|uniref:Zn(2)-C6 fungal-type domain-containing protein n=1 Tax=Tolypocladium paradoxum TaxID=94208 RepID=A0A2S4L7F0_9HYPO|nr:Uncharacterized protein TPAR_01468 [Tolypocladium paradoxum]
MDNRQRSPRASRVLDRERKRAARACDSCRRQKERCDGGVPCRRCFRLGRQCEFSARALGEGDAGACSSLGSGMISRWTPVSSLVTATSWDAAPNDQSASVSHQNLTELAKRLAYLESIVQSHVGSNTTLDLETLRTLAETADRQRSSPPAADASSQTSDFDGFSHWNFSMRIKNWIDQSVAKDGQNPPKSITGFKEYYRAEELQSPSNTLVSLSSLPPRAIADFLIHCFFEHAEANYFVVEKGWLKTKVDLVYENTASLSGRDAGVVCMIFTILAIGTQYAYLESLAAGADGTTQKRTDLFTEDSVGKAFYQQACRLLPDVITVASLESVQACLLMGIYTLPVDASGLAYIHLNLALKLAIQNGMHRKYPSENLDAHIHETRNRVWWTLYTIEKRVGTFHGRPTSIADTDVDADFPVDRSDLWPSSTSVHAAHILATIQLNQQLSKMSHEMSILRTYPKNETSEGLKKLVNLQRELHAWWNGLAICKEPTPHSKTSRQRMHLKLEYCLVRMFVGRVFILPQGGPWDSGSAPTPAADPSVGKNSLRSILVTDCIEAALSVIDACCFLHKSIGLARASYTEFSSCRAALLVITAQCLYTKTYRFRQALRDGLAMLKDMSAGSQSAHSETSLIEAFEKAIASMNNMAPTPGPPDSESEYAKFKRWEQQCKNDPSLLGLTGEGVQNTPAPVAPQPLRPVGGDLRDEAALMPSCTPFFGVDGNFGSFPHNLDELSAFFGLDFGPSLDAETS